MSDNKIVEIDLRNTKDSEIYSVIYSEMQKILELPKIERQDALENIRTTYKGWKAILNGVNWIYVMPAEQESRAEGERKELIESGLMDGQTYDDIQITELEWTDGIPPRNASGRIEKVEFLYGKVPTTKEKYAHKNLSDLTDKDINDIMFNTKRTISVLLERVPREDSRKVKEMLANSLMDLEEKISDCVDFVADLDK